MVKNTEREKKIANKNFVNVGENMFVQKCTLKTLTNHSDYHYSLVDREVGF